MDLPAKSGNRHGVVFQDFLTKFPLVFSIPDQNAICLAKLLVEQVIPLFGVPESLLSDRDTNLLSYLMFNARYKTSTPLPTNLSEMAWSNVLIAP